MILPYIAITILFLLPIIAFLFKQVTNLKGVVIGVTVFITSIVLLAYFSSFSFIGNYQISSLNNKIIQKILNNNEIEDDLFSEFDLVVPVEDQKIWLVKYLNKSISDKKIKSAESLIAFSEPFFKTNEEKLVFYNFYTMLRDLKFPISKEVALMVDLSSLGSLECSILESEIEVYINNGPEIPIASKKSSDLDKILLDSSHSLIPGFDLSSAYLNNEEMLLEAKILCENGVSYSFESTFFFIISSPINDYKIESNQWSTVTQ